MTAEEEPITLAECDRRLREELGDSAPVYITLKRWKKDGRLQKALARGTSGRTARYHFAKVLTIAMGVSVASRPAQVHAPKPAASDGLSTLALQQIAQIFSSQLSAALKAHAFAAPASSAGGVATGTSPDAAASAEGVRALKAAADNLDATRRMLMIRYDSEITTLKGRISQLTEELRVAQSASLDLSKIAQRVSEIAGSLQNR